MLRTTGVRVELGTMVLEVTPDKQVHCVSRSKATRSFRPKHYPVHGLPRAHPRAIGTPGTRPAGIYTAGAAQRYVNMEGYLVGRRILILGSGDIGLIMARRMTLEGAKVLACVEVMPYSGGLTRNIVQCLQDFDIPLYLSHTIVEIQGKKRVEKAIVARWMKTAALSLEPRWSLMWIPSCSVWADPRKRVDPPGRYCHGPPHQGGRGI